MPEDYVYSDRDMSKKPVGPEAYNNKWISSAWGRHGNKQLVEGVTFNPRPRVARALELAAIEPGMNVLDIACGRGEIPALACQRGAFAIGIDFSSTALDVAKTVKQNISTYDDLGIMELVRADACKLPFKDNSFDRITILDIIEHLIPNQLENMFREVRRLLTPTGYAVIHTLPNRWVYDITYPLLQKLYPRLPAEPRGPFDSQIHVNEQDLPSLHRMLNRCQLRHRLWLEQHMAAQARWNVANDQYGDNRDKIYPLLSGIAGRLLELISVTPLKLIFSNDIFGIAWKDRRPQGIVTRLAITEKLACLLPASDKD